MLVSSLWSRDPASPAGLHHDKSRCTKKTPPDHCWRPAAFGGLWCRRPAWTGSVAGKVRPGRPHHKLTPGLWCRRPACTGPRWLNNIGS